MKPKNIPSVDSDSTRLLRFPPPQNAVHPGTSRSHKRHYTTDDGHEIRQGAPEVLLPTLAHRPTYGAATNSAKVLWNSWAEFGTPAIKRAKTQICQHTTPTMAPPPFGVPLPSTHTWLRGATASTPRRALVAVRMAPKMAQSPASALRESSKVVLLCLPALQRAHGEIGAIVWACDGSLCASPWPPTSSPSVATKCSIDLPKLCCRHRAPPSTKLVKCARRPQPRPPRPVSKRTGPFPAD